MNEMDLKTKIEGLKKAIAEHKDFAGTYESNLVEAEQKLKDYNKIALPPIMFDDIYEAIESGINEYDFSDTDNFDIEYGIEYDEKVSKLFTEAECPEDDAVEKVFTQETGSC